MMNYRILGASLVAAGMFLSVGCEDTSLEDLLSEGDAKVSESYLKTEAALVSIYSIVDASLRDSTFQAADSSVVDGAIVLRDGSNISIDFGNGVDDGNGTERKGLIQVVETGDYMTSASLAITLPTFSVNDDKVTGSIALDKIGTDFALVVDSFSAGQEIEIEANKTISWKNGFTTLADNSDDVFDISGTASGLDMTDNRQLSTSITEAMNYDRSCEYKMVSGIVELTLQPGDTIADITEVEIDFLLNDGCDNVARIKVAQGETEATTTKQFSGF